MKASDLFVKSLENEGVEYIFALPGEENLDFLQSLRKSSIRLILCRHEQGAGFMAATYGRLTGKPGVCLATLGPGATNLVTPAAFAFLSGFPMVMITGQKPIKVSKQAKFQIIDVVDMMRPITKYTQQIIDAIRIPSQVREAFRQAAEEKPGTVHLEFPEDIAQEDCNASLFDVVAHFRPKVDEEAINQATEMILAAKKPILLIGASVNSNDAAAALAELVDKTGMYFFNTQMGKGVIDERHPRYLGCAALSSGDFIHKAVGYADLILNVGHGVVEKPPFFMEHRGKQVIHLNFTPAEIDPVYFPQLNVVGDISNSVRKLAQKLSSQKKQDIDFFERTKSENQKLVDKYSSDTRFPILPQRLVKLMRGALASQDIISLDNGMYKIWFARDFPCHQPNTLLLDNALASMGSGLPAAMMAKMLHPERKVVAVCGDGGFLMNSQEMETAVRLGLDLTVIILNDGAYGMIKWKQEDMGFEDFGLDYGNPDFVKYAESFGAKGYRPSSDGEFSKLLSQCLQSSGVHLIDLPTDYSLNHSILNVELKKKTEKL